jgi:hypothetical protein
VGEAFLFLAQCSKNDAGTCTHGVVQQLADQVPVCNCSKSVTEHAQPKTPLKGTFQQARRLHTSVQCTAQRCAVQLSSRSFNDAPRSLLLKCYKTHMAANRVAATLAHCVLASALTCSVNC